MQHQLDHAAFGSIHCSIECLLSDLLLSAMEVIATGKMDGHRICSVAINGQGRM